MKLLKFVENPIHFWICFEVLVIYRIKFIICVAISYFPFVVKLIIRRLAVFICFNACVSRGLHNIPTWSKTNECWLEWKRKNKKKWNETHETIQKSVRRSRHLAMESKWTRNRHPEWDCIIADEKKNWFVIMVFVRKIVKRMCGTSATARPTWSHLTHALTLCVRTYFGS